MGVAPVAIVLLHHAVEGVFALAFFTDDEVEAKCGQCAFLIIADDGVGAVFVLFVELVPCAETGLGKCLFQTALFLLITRLRVITKAAGVVPFVWKIKKAGED